MSSINTKALGDPDKDKPKIPKITELMKDKGPKPAQMMRRNRVFDGNTDWLGKFDPDHISFRQMRGMRRDPMIALGLHYQIVPMVNAAWTIECEDPQIAAFVDGALRRIYTPLIQGLLHNALAFGFAPMVKRFERLRPDWQYDDEDGEQQDVWPKNGPEAVVWNTPQFLDPEGAEPKFKDDGRTFDGFTHAKYDGESGNGLEVPVTHALWFTNEKDKVFGDWYGYPRTGYSLRYWWSYWNRHLLGDRHFEQDADPPLVITYPPGRTSVDDDVIDNADLALGLGQDLRDGATLALPSDVYINEDDGKPTGTKKWDVKFLPGGENLNAFQASFEYLDVMKLRSIMVPEQAIVEGKGGTSSRNVASTYGALFAESAAILINEIDQLINDYMIPDLVAQNFTNPPTVRKVTTGFREEDLSLVTSLITSLIHIDPQSLGLDVREMVRTAGLPQIKESEQEQIIDDEEPPKQDDDGDDNVDSYSLDESQELFAAARDGDMDYVTALQQTNDPIMFELATELHDILEGAAKAIVTKSIDPETWKDFIDRSNRA